MSDSDAGAAVIEVPVPVAVVDVVVVVVVIVVVAVVMAVVVVVVRVLVFASGDPASAIVNNAHVGSACECAGMTVDGKGIAGPVPRRVTATGPRLPIGAGWDGEPIETASAVVVWELNRSGPGVVCKLESIASPDVVLGSPRSTAT